MTEYPVDKPEGLSDPVPFDYQLIGPDIEKLSRDTLGRLKDERSDDSKPHLFPFWGLLTASFQTYRAVIKLVTPLGDRYPAYGTQARALGRTLLDIVFNVVFLAQRPQEHSRRYEQAGYRAMWEQYQRELGRYRDNPEWQHYLELKGNQLEKEQTDLGLTLQQRENPTKHIENWPGLSGIRQSGVFDEETKEFLNRLYRWEYGSTSDLTHQGWFGMAIAVFSASPEMQWYPGKLESDAVSYATVFFLMVLSEIESVCCYGNASKLCYLWTLYGNYMPLAMEYYDMRYRALLSS